MQQNSSHAINNAKHLKDLQSTANASRLWASSAIQEAFQRENPNKPMPKLPNVSSVTATSRGNIKTRGLPSSSQVKPGPGRPLIASLQTQEDEVSLDSSSDEEIPVATPSRQGLLRKDLPQKASYSKTSSQPESSL